MTPRFASSSFWALVLITARYNIPLQLNRSLPRTAPTGGTWAPRSGNGFNTDYSIGTQWLYDPDLHMAYCASGQGQISVVKVEGEKLTKIGDVPDATGCHSIVIDPKTYIAWTSFSPLPQKSNLPWQFCSGLARP